MNISNHTNREKQQNQGTEMVDDSVYIVQICSNVEKKTTRNCFLLGELKSMHTTKQAFMYSETSA